MEDPYSIVNLPRYEYEELRSRLEIDQEDVVNAALELPQKIGHYGLNVDKAYETRTIIYNDSNLSFLVKLPPASSIDIDVAQGATAYQAIDWEMPINAKLDDLLKYLLEKKTLQWMKHVYLPKTPVDFDFVTYRGVLTKIMVTPFVNDNWLIGACRYRGTIYLCPYFCQPRTRKSAVRKSDNYFSYSGYRFEHAITSKKINHEGINFEPFKPVLGEYSALISCKIKTVSRPKRFRLLYAAEVDCLDVGKTREDQNIMKNFVEVKTMPVVRNEAHLRSLIRFRFIKWWAQCYLVGIPKLIVGYRDDDYHVNKVESMIVSDLSHNRTNIPWTKQKCLDFLYFFLEHVHNTLIRDTAGDPSNDGGNSKQVYLFFPNYDNPRHKRNILAYKMLHPQQFLILPSWYVEKFPKQA